MPSWLFADYIHSSRDGKYIRLRKTVGFAHSPFAVSIEARLLMRPINFHSPSCLPHPRLLLRWRGVDWFHAQLHFHLNLSDQLSFSQRCYARSSVYANFLWIMLILLLCKPNKTKWAHCFAGATLQVNSELFTIRLQNESVQERD
jgi:hypothetical protein